jgi:pyruvate dehydrogenase E2 component (dihydrolipoamide acetyltransferase)
MNNPAPASPATSAAPAAAPASAPAAQQAAPEAQPAQTSADGRIKASPLAKMLAKDKGIDLTRIAGSGDGGRIIRKDVDNFNPAAQPAAPATAAAPAPAARATVMGQEGYTDTQLTSMRKTIARRLGESMFTAPHFYLKMEVCMDNAIKARVQMNEVSPTKISFQDMLIKACALALKKHPAVNSSWMGDFIRTYDHVHIGSAIALPEGLIVPVLRFADQKSLSQIAVESKELYDKARNKKIQPADFTGNTFTISNLGMMDIDEFTAIINPPDSCILAVGKIKEVVVKKGDGFTTTQMMKLTLSCDHRSVDGAVGASFLQTLKKYMENPVTMLV